MPLDCNVQARLSKCDLATIAKYYYEQGNFAALKSASALVRTMINDYVRIIVQNEAIEAISYSDEADELLSELGIFPRTIVRGYLRNLQQEKESGSQLQPEVDKRNRPLKVKPALRTQQHGKLSMDAHNDEEIKREIEKVMQDTFLQAQLKKEVSNASIGNSAFEQAWAAKYASNDEQDMLNKANEGE